MFVPFGVYVLVFMLFIYVCVFVYALMYVYDIYVCIYLSVFTHLFPKRSFCGWVFL